MDFLLPNFIAAKLPLRELLLIGAAAALVIIVIGYSRWRLAIKAAFVVLLLEGAIRKWVFPQGQELVYFFKDVILIGPYLRFFFAPDPEMRSWRLNIPTLGLLSLLALLIPYALNPNINSILLGLYGLKIYVYYIPLIFIMPYLFRTKDELIRQLTYYVLLAIPICLLGLAQWGADASSPLNVYAQQENLAAAGGVSGFGFGDKVRITGTFSYITGHTTFVMFFTALLLVVLSLEKVRWKWLLIGVCAPLLLANGSMSGSRAFLYVDALILVGFFIAGSSGKMGMSKNFLAIMIWCGVICALGGAYLFYDAYFYMAARNKASTDSFRDRTIVYPLKSLEMGLEEGGLTGLGIGTTHPATEGIRRALKIGPPLKIAPVFDMESGQILVELGPLGFLAWYGFRLWLLMLIWQGFSRAPPGPAKTIALATFILTLPHFILGVVLNHTANMLLFGMTGLAMLTWLEPIVRRHPRAYNIPNAKPASSR